MSAEPLSVDHVLDEILNLEGLEGCDFDATSGMQPTKMDMRNQYNIYPLIN
jgi:hypothetical protein